MSDIKIGKITLGMCATNAYFLYREGSNDVIFFDPPEEGELIYNKLKDKGFDVKAIVLTHGHFDHILGIKELKANSGAKVYALKEEEELLMNERLNVSHSVGADCIIKPDFLVNDGDVLSLCGIDLKVIHTPGHTEGSACFYIEEAGYLIAGDTLFCESIGRTDLPTGSGKKIIESIKEKLLVLPDNVRVYPGHGPSTTIGEERDNNPFLM